MNKKIILGRGKLRRIYLSNLQSQKIKRLLKRRRGECLRCGACCKLMFRCPAFKKENGIAKCKIYKYRSRVCQLFPLDKRDLADRDLIEPTKKCGFWFKES
jgi:hypothetical protein